MLGGCCPVNVQVIAVVGDFENQPTTVIAVAKRAVRASQRDGWRNIAIGVRGQKVKIPTPSTALRAGSGRKGRG
ncbi:hypothetical protein SBA1_680054 [Candidatus Sulfotelmatobacter kueseliae]|uniref:Uncharacterized protein n=1 Tax=Candidatus Sulfotelmatobacter kueseliae TaxID=2042962 RepID=A0A2U3L4M0_9BACT|nr:hypothetical protein SBA1_680054 [Candidatus Sulfotelmatobacter kueseliae]